MTAQAGEFPGSLCSMAHRGCRAVAACGIASRVGEEQRAILSIFPQELLRGGGGCPTWVGCSLRRGRGRPRSPCVPPSRLPVCGRIPPNALTCNSAVRIGRTAAPGVLQPAASGRLCSPCFRARLVKAHVWEHFHGLDQAMQ